ncbi:response regulator transcription factor [Paenisporosarcina quisquiliarum]|uniref:Response regulator transcription factor n=1 Tax=Paenisporosarcina quisquiliarum TaxID=365346 RepID=A0A9X3LJ20_9BACL|nr:response regulator transcription factor [Paenisporosarcina quisquiliarum]MCZ8538345.1 response regulator transcription factor [Paenisporosarcina quisquiliarum]
MSLGTILVVDDELEMRRLIQSFLVAEGYTVLEAANGMDALDFVKKANIDLMLLDVMMPYVDGYTVTKEVRKTSDIPIIFLSARGDEWDKVKGLRFGADDYLVKPFHSGELIARIETVLRRSTQAKQKNKLLKAGPILIDETNHEAYVEGTYIPLTRKEFSLLSLLVANQNHLLTRTLLMETVWGLEYSGTERTVDTHIKTLRLKLHSAGSFIKTVRGLGYKLEVT